ncbi:MAG TPA: sorbosone dehydrogenase family protein, partial [Gammaproteobacteria bacterium]|nr:sorbosone dehydrogenase family protein [Gammaproteobacteria bacterium]
MRYLNFSLFWLLLLNHSTIVVAHNLPLEKIKLPPGFSITVYAENVKNARQMALGTQGTLFVGSKKAGKVYAITALTPGKKSTEVRTIADNLNLPSGIAFKDGALYIAEVSRILRYDNIEENIHNPGKPKVIYDKLPKEQHHGWKFIGFGPDNLLYVPVGAPCDNCLSHDPRFASLLR